ncbi:MAG TPA: hypothetical protein VF624_10120 [Tepidisphaeraceae bacterium]|jgi:hypothetical protein
MSSKSHESSRRSIPRKLFGLDTLEPRRLLSTTSVYGTSYGPDTHWGTSGSGETLVVPGDTLDEIGDVIYKKGTTATFTKQLPAHSMVKITGRGFVSSSITPAANAKITFTFGTTVIEAGLDSIGDFVPLDEDGAWKAHDSSSVTVNVAAVNLPSDAQVVIDLWVSIYTPTVSVTGGGTTSEDSTTPTTFAVSRDLPSGYVGASAGDDAIPDTEVSLSRGGTATSGTDYTGDLPTTTTTIADSLASNTFSIQPILDGVPESDETVVLTAQSGSGYGINAAASAALLQVQNRVVWTVHITDPGNWQPGDNTSIQMTAYADGVASHGVTPTLQIFGGVAGDAITAATAVAGSPGRYTATLTIGPGGGRPFQIRTFVNGIASGTENINVQ